MNNTKKVIRLLKKHATEPDDASPNFVADFARSHGINLTSQEIVEISNTFEPVTRVIFRTDKYGKFKGWVTAWFPDYSHKRNYMTELYQRVGQHGEGTYIGCRDESRPSTRAEYIDLKRELESIGYRLKIVKRAKIVYK